MLSTPGAAVTEVSTDTAVMPIITAQPLGQPEAGQPAASRRPDVQTSRRLDVWTAGAAGLPGEELVKDGLLATNDLDNLRPAGRAGH